MIGASLAGLKMLFVNISSVCPGSAARHAAGRGKKRIGRTPSGVGAPAPAIFA